VKEVLFLYVTIYGARLKFFLANDRPPTSRTDETLKVAAWQRDNAIGISDYSASTVCLNSFFLFPFFISFSNKKFGLYSFCSAVYACKREYNKG
jgi:hypothetical protein